MMCTCMCMHILCAGILAYAVCYTRRSLLPGVCTYVCAYNMRRACVNEYDMCLHVYAYNNVCRHTCICCLLYKSEGSCLEYAVCMQYCRSIYCMHMCIHVTRMCVCMSYVRSLLPGKVSFAIVTGLFCRTSKVLFPATCTYIFE